MKFLPLYPILTRYPFLRVSSKVFSFDVERELEMFGEAIEKAKAIVEKAMEGKTEGGRFEEEGEFFCQNCDEKCCECSEVGKLENCSLCMTCFENCSLSYPTETWRLLQSKAKMSLLTYIASRMIVSALDDWVRMRYAVSEASYYRSLLSGDSEAVVRLVAIDLGIKLRNWNMHVSAFVKVSSRLKDDNWRLVNRKLKKGYVETTKNEVLRAIEELLRVKLFEKVPVSSVVDDAVKELARRAKREARNFKVDLGKADIKCLPPCMKEILSELQRGMNVPHTARFAITSFLLNIGMSVEEVIALFKTAPDFDEQKTRYQVEHIAGERGKGTEYTSPSCDTMRTYNNCVADCKVTHPLVYYKNCIKKKS